MKISDIINKNEYILCEVDTNLEFKRLTTTPDKIKEGDILILPNEQRLPKIEKTPLAVICGLEVPIPKHINTIRVKNSRLSTATAYYRYNHVDTDGMTVIGITGTNGKTTTATLIKEILVGCGHSVGFIGTGRIEIKGEVISDNNYSMTTPDPPLLYSAIQKMKDSGCDIIVMEVSSHALALEKVTPLSFNYAVFTNLSNEHMDFHQNIEDYFLTKLKLFNKSKYSYFNIDDEYGQRAYDMSNGIKKSASLKKAADIWANEISNKGLCGLEYVYNEKNVSFKTTLNLPGEYNIYNAMLASAVCIDYGCDTGKVQKILSDIKQLNGRYEVINDKISVIIDYAHTSFAFEKILYEISKSKNGRSLTVVFGCGGDRDRSKRPVMARAAEKFADRIVLTSDNSRNENPDQIFSDIISGFTTDSYEIIEDREKAIISAINNAYDGDIVAIIGKGPERYNITKDGYSYFCEKEIVLSALAKRNVR